MVAIVLFAVDSALVLTWPLLPFDVPVALAVQRFPWGPLAAWMSITNAIAGYWQALAGAIAIVAVALADRRGGWLMLIGSFASVLDNVLKQMVERHRPTPDLVHILTPASGYSYPSGHAVFYTWLYFMLAFSLAPKLPPRARPFLWSAAFLLIALACAGRVWAGDHWPSDVLGGFLLALAWSAFVLWLPERWLPSPRRSWLRLGGWRTAE
jgi:undecaprenyl-diphosphatase